jgi:hypothetical protein
MRLHKLVGSGFLAGGCLLLLSAAQPPFEAVSPLAASVRLAAGCPPAKFWNCRDSQMEYCPTAVGCLWDDDSGVPTAGYMWLTDFQECRAGKPECGFYKDVFLFCQ